MVPSPVIVNLIFLAKTPTLIIHTALTGEYVAYKSYNSSIFNAI